MIKVPMKSRTLFVPGMVLSGLLASAPAMAAAPCEDLAKFQAPNVTITSATMVDNLAAVASTVAKSKLEAPFCRVSGFLTPTSDSHIGFEVWLPSAERWNNKLQAVGNGGFYGFLNHRAMLPALNRRYATMTTDLGHVNAPGASEDATWALGHPEKVIDYKFRGGHLSALVAKQIIAAYYGAAPRHAYYAACSAGAIQGLTELIRYPKDFDGYIIGNANPNHLDQQMTALWNTLEASLKNPDEALKPAHMGLIHKAVLQQCAGKDGGLASDPFLSNPPACKFEPKTLLCQAGQDAATCLSTAQVDIVNKLYQGPVNPRSGQSIAAGLTPGTELGWPAYFTGKKNPAAADRPWGGFLTYMAYADPTYLSEQKYLAFDFDRDYDKLRRIAVAGETLESSWNARDRNLDAFQAAGGKLIQYHGWDDPNIPALAAVRFFTEIVEDQAKRHRLTAAQAMAATQQFHRLFMVPGMGHCTVGEGPWSFGQGNQAPLKADPQYDTLSALERWVEQGVAPEQFIGSRVDAKTNAVEMARPICAYPKVPVFKGIGNGTDAAQFSCALPPAAATTNK
jgi:feruloyl esterase